MAARKWRGSAILERARLLIMDGINNDISCGHKRGIASPSDFGCLFPSSPWKECCGYNC